MYVGYSRKRYGEDKDGENCGGDKGNYLRVELNMRYSYILQRRT